MKDIFNPSYAEKRITGKIIRQLVSGWYLIKDTQDHLYRVAGRGFRVGETVAVIDGQIVGRAGVEAVPVEFQV